MNIIKHTNEFIKITGLLPFFMIFLDIRSTKKQRLFAFIVVINGLLCHGFYNKKLFSTFDIITNAILIIYVNINASWQPYTSLLSVKSILSWYLKPSTGIQEACVHVFLVQLPLAICLMNFYGLHRSYVLKKKGSSRLVPKSIESIMDASGKLQSDVPNESVPAHDDGSDDGKHKTLENESVTVTDS